MNITDERQKSVKPTVYNYGDVVAIEDQFYLVVKGDDPISFGLVDLKSGEILYKVNNLIDLAKKLSESRAQIVFADLSIWDS